MGDSVYLAGPTRWRWGYLHKVQVRAPFSSFGKTEHHLSCPVFGAIIGNDDATDTLLLEDGR